MGLASLMHHMAFAPGPSSYVRSLWRDLHLCMWELGAPVEDVIDAKMAVNRLRLWKSDGTGHGYHVREKAPVSFAGLEPNAVLDAHAAASRVP
jgi:hypothetical protein